MPLDIFTAAEIEALRAAISAWCEDCDSEDNEGHHAALDSAFAKAQTHSPKA